MSYINEQGDVRAGKVIAHVTLVLLALIIIFGSFGTVKAGQRGVHVRMGAVTGRIVEPGLYFKLPFVEKVVKMDVQIQKEEVPADAASKDLQTVNSTVALNYHLEPSSVARVYQEVNKDYNLRIIAPALQEAVKAATAKFTAEQLITERQQVRDEIKTLLRSKLLERGIIVDEFNIINFDFSRAFNEAIESKVTAEQNALGAKNKLEQVKYESEQAIISAQGRAEALRIEAQAIASNPNIVQLRAIEKWDGKLPQVTGGSVPFVNIK